MSNSLGKLTRIKIEGFKSIKKLDLEFHDLNIIIGANGAGKTNLINFFKFMKKILDQDLENYTAEQGGSNKILHFGRKITPEIYIALLFKPNAYKTYLIPTTQDKFIFKDEEGFFIPKSMGYSGQTKPIPLDNKGGLESKIKETNLPILQYIYSHIKDWRVYHFHDTSFNARVKQTWNIADYEQLHFDGGNLAPFLRNIKINYPESYKDIVSTIHKIAPYFHDFILEPESLNTETIKLKWKHKGTDEYFDSNDLSDGTLRFICLVTLLFQPKLPKTIILDEPELGLHPFALNILANIFKVVSTKSQIIASTQSTVFLNNFDVKDIIVVDRQNNASNFKRLNEDELKEWLEDFSIGELWEKNVIGGNQHYEY